MAGGLHGSHRPYAPPYGAGEEQERKTKMAFPVFETDRLVIRPFTLDDLEALHRILDFELMWSGEPLTREDRQEVLEGNIAAYGLDVPCGWRAIEGKEGHPLMGMIR